MAKDIQNILVDPRVLRIIKVDNRVISLVEIRVNLEDGCAVESVVVETGESLNLPHALRQDKSPDTRALRGLKNSRAKITENGRREFQIRGDRFHFNWISR